MSNKLTRKTSYTSLLENSLSELFSPDSKKALFNYDDFRLLDLDGLKLIDTKELKLLDTKQLKLLDLAVIGSFFQYIGALSLTLAMGFMFGLGMFALHGKVNTTVLADNESNTSVRAAIPAEEVTFKNIERNSASSVSTFEVLIANNEGDSGQPVQVRVLGTSDVLTEAVEATEVSVSEVETQIAVSTSVESCSFSVAAGSKTSRYSDGSRLVASNATKICADTNTGSSNFTWNLGGKTYESTDNCINASALNGANSVSVSVSNTVDSEVASCSLSLGESQIAGL